MPRTSLELPTGPLGMEQLDQAMGRLLAAAVGVRLLHHEHLGEVSVEDRPIVELLVAVAQRVENLPLGKVGGRTMREVGQLDLLSLMAVEPLEEALRAALDHERNHRRPDYVAEVAAVLDEHDIDYDHDQLSLLLGDSLKVFCDDNRGLRGAVDKILSRFKASNPETRRLIRKAIAGVEDESGSIKVPRDERLALHFSVLTLLRRALGHSTWETVVTSILNVREATKVEIMEKMRAIVFADEPDEEAPTN